jgi:hypothetical protein
MGGTLCDSVITNLIRHDVPGEAVTLAGGTDSTRNVTIADVTVARDAWP